MTHTTIRRHLEDLEHQLHLVLFTRSPDGLKPTLAARKLERTAILMEGAAESLLRTASAETGSASGVVRLLCRATTASELLPPLIVSLRALHPNLRLDVATSNDPGEVERGAADIFLGLGDPLNEALVTRHLGDLAVGLYAHARYVSHAGEPAALDDLKNFSLIGSRSATAGAVYPWWSPGIIEPGDAAFRSDSRGAQLAAIRAGVGIGVMPVCLAGRDPALIRILPNLGHQYAVVLMALGDQGQDRRVRVVIDALVEHVAGFLGDGTAHTAGTTRRGVRTPQAGVRNRRGADRSDPA
jgi:DNA-binding transcriptional LysR family regulator